MESIYVIMHKKEVFEGLFFTEEVEKINYETIKI